MGLPLLTYPPSSQNQQVTGFEVPGDEQPRIYTTANLPSTSELDQVIVAAYRQIFDEQQMIASNRHLVLESQLSSGQITVRDFVRGLATSESFRLRNFDTNNNYRFAQMAVQRILGRDVYGDREKIAWSIVLATQGLPSFIDALVNSEEYLTNFGEDKVPFQRRRILPQRVKGDLPFARMARYGKDYRDKLPKPSLTGTWYGQRADGLFTQSEQFDFQTFVQRINGPKLAAVLITSAGIITVMLALSAFAQ